ncbi:MAG: hypothetical protein FJ267_19000, partial [Planctomycetes bacterium]|nr:hypothetical protein [Planctomycetota bacterium]
MKTFRKVEFTIDHHRDGIAKLCKLLLYREWTLIPISVAFLICNVANSNGSTLNSKSETPRHLEPYNVRIVLALDSSQSGTFETSTIIRDIQQSCDRFLGELWNVDVSITSSLHPANGKKISRLEWESVIPLAQSVEAEKTADTYFVCAVESRSSSYAI